MKEEKLIKKMTTRAILTEILAEARGAFRRWMAEKRRAVTKESVEKHIAAEAEWRSDLREPVFGALCMIHPELLTENVKTTFRTAKDILRTIVRERIEEAIYSEWALIETELSGSEVISCDCPHDNALVKRAAHRPSEQTIECFQCHHLVRLLAGRARHCEQLKEPYIEAEIKPLSMSIQ